MRFVKVNLELQLDEVQDQFLTDHIKNMGFVLSPQKMKLAKQALIQEITKRNINSMSNLRSMVENISNPSYIDLIQKATKRN